MDTLSPEMRSAQMAKIRSKDTSPELAVRRMVHRMGFRYRLHVGSLPGKPDLVFPAKRKAIFVHGCFWHRHGAICPLSRMPKSRIEFWQAKLAQNKKRDEKTRRKLRAAGWRTMVVWECQLKHPETLEKRLLKFLGGEL
jgi:DNA mismatch endonuclease (patch repair protein)